MPATQAILSINPDDTDSVLRGKYAALLLAAGVDRLRVSRIVNAKKSQGYIDLKAAQRSPGRRDRLVRDDRAA
jgi:hypothetical protein